MRMVNIVHYISCKMLYLAVVKVYRMREIKRINHIRGFFPAFNRLLEFDLLEKMRTKLLFVV